MHRLAEDGLTLTEVPVLDLRLGDLPRRIVRDGSGHDVLLRLGEVLGCSLARGLCQIPENIPVGLGLPHRCNSRRERMDERVQIRTVEIGLFVPRGRRKHDVGVERRRVHTEI